MTADEDDAPPGEADAIYRFRTFENIAMGVDGALLWSTLDNVDWYWGLFNTAIVAETTFKSCKFRGASFRGVHFVACRFVDCRFALDNRPAACSFDDVTLTECAFVGCVVEPDPRGRPVFARTRFYGCEQSRSVGMEGLF